MTKHIGIIDLGGQYCHLISRRLRDFDIKSTIYENDVSEGQLKDCAGIILSGGPSSVYDPGSPTIDPTLLRTGRPVLGICYGHQLMVGMLGGSVGRSAGEYGPSVMTLEERDSIFIDLPDRQVVWMSHTDSVEALPQNAVRLARTERCANAAFAIPERKMFGVQFHPEVVHTEHGGKMLRNFSARICGLEETGRKAGRVPSLTESISEQVGKRSVFFLVSGGVDSTVAFALCARALPPDRILGLYVDTGLMRKGETQELVANLRSIGLDRRLRIRDESDRFLSALHGVTDPEEKRHIIGRLFVDVQAEAMAELGISPGEWLLGQGTIYPDTIESGGSKGRAAVIKTHHNRCPEIRELIERGLVIEPLSDFYKDEVREIGQELNLDRSLTNRWPFPGPGLAIRCLCSQRESGPGEVIQLPLRFGEYRAIGLPLSSVGVQGDARTYREVAAVWGPLDYGTLQDLSTTICNMYTGHNRVVVHLGGKSGDPSSVRVKQAGMTRERIELLREADGIVRGVLQERDLGSMVWQFPVVLLPVAVDSRESVVLRPVESTDGMTAKFARLPEAALREMTDQILKLDGVDSVFLDITDKPPATIEWE